MRFVRLLTLVALASSLSACITLDQIDSTYPKEEQSEVMQRMIARESYQKSQSNLDASIEGRVSPVERRQHTPKPSASITPYEKQLQTSRGKLFDLCLDKNNAFYFAHTPCTPSEITSKDMTSDVRPSSKERQAIAELFSTMQSLNDDMLLVMKKSGNPDLMAKAAQSQREMQPQIKALQKAFVDGKLTWGQYNQRRYELYKLTH